MAVSPSFGQFKVEKFNIRSMTFFALFLLCIIFSGLGISMLFAIPGIFFGVLSIFPTVNRGITRKLISITNNRLFAILSFFPNINFHGDWYMTLKPKEIKLSSFGDILHYLKQSLFEISAIHLIFLIVGLRFGHAWQTIRYNPDGIFFGIVPGSFGVAFFLLPFFVGSYFAIIWTIRDSGLKLYQVSESSDEKSREFTEVSDLERSYKSLIGIFIGFPILLWAVQHVQNAEVVPIPGLPYPVNLAIFFGGLYIISIGISILTLMLYLRSGKYEELVNQTRYWIRDSTRTLESVRQQFVPTEPPQSTPRPPQVRRSQGSYSRQRIAAPPAYPPADNPTDLAKPLSDKEPLASPVDDPKDLAKTLPGDTNTSAEDDPADLAKKLPGEDHPEKPKFCIQCGQKIGKGMNFCIKCGREI